MWKPRNLYELAEHCEFDAQRDEKIRDRIAIRIFDNNHTRKSCR